MTNKAKYMGHEVEVLRDAQPGDAGYDAGKDQVRIRNSMGNEKLVLRDEAEGAPTRDTGSDDKKAKRSDDQMTRGGAPVPDRSR